MSQLGAGLSSLSSPPSTLVYSILNHFFSPLQSPARALNFAALKSEMNSSIGVWWERSGTIINFPSVAAKLPEQLHSVAWGSGPRGILILPISVKETQYTDVMSRLVSAIGHCGHWRNTWQGEDGLWTNRIFKSHDTVGSKIFPQLLTSAKNTYVVVTSNKWERQVCQL